MIAAFVAEKMSRYLAGGMDAEIAGDFIRGELSAIYEGNHYSRDKSGAMRLTPPPESLDPIEAMRKADKAIAEILNYCTLGARKGPTTGAKTERVETHGNTPENPSREAPESEKRNGLEGLKNYVRKSA